MSAPAQTPLQQTLRWMTTHAGFPARRLPDKAELLLLIATAVILMGKLALGGSESPGDDAINRAPAKPVDVEALAKVEAMLQKPLLMQG